MSAIPSREQIDASTAGADCTTAPCVTTYHNDAQRDGVNSQESLLDPSASVFNLTQANSRFGLLGSTPALDGLVYAQPLYLHGVQMAASSGCSGTQNIVLVATENNTVYAYAVTNVVTTTGHTFTMTPCWNLPLNQANEYAVPFTALPQDSNGNPCQNVVPQSGITSTPVIDSSVTPPIMYVVTFHQLANSGGYTYRLHAIKLDRGSEAATAYDFKNLFPTGFNFTVQNQRPGLAMFKHSQGVAYIYTAFGSFCDLGSFSGYVAGISFTYTGTPSFSTITSPASGSLFNAQTGTGASQGGIWMAGGAPAVDSHGGVYFSAGNGGWNGQTSGRSTQFGNSIVKLATTSSSLFAQDYYTPNDWSDLNGGNNASVCTTYGPATCLPNYTLILPPAPNGGDFDLGSGGVTLIAPVGVTTQACTSAYSELVVTGKEGVTYGDCYNSTAGSTLQTIMGGLDGCGYACNTPSTEANTACSESTTPGNGNIAQCFRGINTSTTISGSPGTRGTAAFWAGPASSPQNYMYLGGSGAALGAYQVALNSGMFNTTVDPETNPKVYPYPGTTPSVSWDGSTTGSGAVWAIDSGGYGSWTTSSSATEAAVLVAYQAVPQMSGGSLTLAELWASSESVSQTGPGAVKFTVPTVADGLVFVAGGKVGDAPGPAGGTGVNCTASALVNTSFSNVCLGQMVVYGLLKSQ